MLKEFREFISRGNVIDLAVAVIIGVAFTGIVTSFVDNIITPILGIFLGGVLFSKGGQNELSFLDSGWHYHRLDY